MSFWCHGCGACCNVIGMQIQSNLKKFNNYPHKGLQQTLKMMKDFPHKINKDGSCTKLDKETGQCTIYEDRPEICRVDSVYKYIKDIQSREDYDEKLEESCKRHMKMSGYNDFEISKIYENKEIQ